MNYILEKSNKQVIWINADSNKLTGAEAWGNFDTEIHEIVYSLHYNPQVGDTFKAEIENGCIKNFQPKPVYDKKTMIERVLQNWEDVIDPETETEDEPLKDSNGNFLTYQNHTESGWVADDELTRESLLTTNGQIFNSKLESYRGNVPYHNTIWDSGKKYLENIQKTLTLYNKQRILSIPEWRDANNQFHSLNAKELSELSDLIELDLFDAGQNLYAKKWEMEETISSLPSGETLDLATIWADSLNKKEEKI
ncbi:DUF4376 domain-containing protein [Leptospira interrogans]|uniref:DUF4376 domain-containing protein n=1 Tax=Leptospira interrogans serovar Pyrogenes str. 200701872 TaxID=1193029 RepID=M6ZKL3_LEPIR|nr:DUF4376 domain-containing protein [Leptospira interrogans]EMP06626.1 hypothetical protein LEP1GSC124_1968 [Leptospira interrogans serovar Pyrogenes str. 200701872]EMN60832.1 hypothetical protein LEP1GSC092_4164 [Leptospira interrogans serovar Pyrogenes str. R168]EMP07631.1 hypothetical protein LEP1GSC124_4149 [Leptospira interrogans serovar Pyrogenes str. 200701872]ULG83853.1 DUF4376 domain-containing protein [Leptospira interrogans]ULG89279.1 DUF4376 domain-containing protein [Leptospira i